MIDQKTIDACTDNISKLGEQGNFYDRNRAIDRLLNMVREDHIKEIKYGKPALKSN